MDWGRIRIVLAQRRRGAEKIGILLRQVYVGQGEARGFTRIVANRMQVRPETLNRASWLLVCV